MRMKSNLGVDVVVEFEVIIYSILVWVKVTTCPDGWVGGWVVEEGNEINAILNSVEVVVEVGVELGNNKKWVQLIIININTWTGQKYVCVYN